MTKTMEPLTTSSVARRLKRAEGTIRGWVRDGRLVPMTQTESGVRLFDPAAIERLATEMEERRG
jgi:DNA-binding transcriptional MerR regulator